MLKVGYILMIILSFLYILNSGLCNQFFLQCNISSFALVMDLNSSFITVNKTDNIR